MTGANPASQPQASHHEDLQAIQYLVLLGVIQVKDLPESEPPLPYLVLWTVMFGGAWLVGSAWHALLRATEEARLRAALQERHDLARDLHDTVADALTTLAMRTEQLAADSVGPSPDELAAVGAEAARAVDGLRRIVDLLRHDDSAQTTWTVPTIGALIDDATDRLHRGGFSPRVAVEGDLPALPGLVAHQLARLVEEATNNILRHGDPDGETAIVVEAADSVLALAFVNQVRRRPRRRTARSTFGLVGMRERAAALGGTVTSSRSQDTWLTSLAIPYREPTHQPGDP